MAFDTFTGPLLKTTRLDTRVEDKKSEDDNWRKVCRAVDARDHFICRACKRRCVMTLAIVANRWERHHVIPRSLGGKDTKAGVCGLCLTCHNLRHVKRILSIAGNADKLLTFQMGEKTWRG